jgi:uncharacterized protein DUF4252
MELNKSIMTGALLFLLVAPSGAQGLEQYPGYFDLSEVEGFVNQETTLEVNVKGALLRMVAEAARIENDTLAEMLLKLQAVQVRGYTLDDDAAEAIIDRLGPIARRLSEAGWQRVVRVREDDEFVEMLVRDTSGEKVEGMIVFVVDEGQNETIFVNIVGEIDPEDIGRIGRGLNIRVLKDF